MVTIVYKECVKPVIIYFVTADLGMWSLTKYVKERPSEHGLNHFINVMDMDDDYTIEYGELEACLFHGKYYNMKQVTSFVPPDKDAYGRPCSMIFQKAVDFDYPLHVHTTIEDIK
jgi:hypothetical protein